MLREDLHQETREKKYEAYQVIANDLLLYNKRFCVPKSTKLKHMIIDECHRIHYVGHPGYQKMIITVR
jgi:hypothetical protein